MNLRTYAVPSLFAFVLACSSVDAATPGESDDAGTLPTPVGDASVDGARPGTDGGVEPGVTFHVQFDYRFDKKGFFADPKRKAALESAARIWGKRIKSTFVNVPAGTFILVRDPEHPNVSGQTFNIDYEIDDVVVFVGSSELGGGVTGMSAPSFGLSGIADKKLQADLSARSDSVPFQPWTGWISFDETTDFFYDDSEDGTSAIPSGKMDFVSVALHELGHVLGFGTAEPFKANISSGKYTGSKAVAVFGGPVPLSGTAHFPNDVQGANRPLMDLSDATGTRYLPTPLDIAVFEDLGFSF